MATQFIAAGTETLPSIAAADIINFPEGAQTVSANLNHSGIGYISQINAARAFIGNVGTAANPLMCGVSGSINWDAGGGSLFIQPASTSGNTLVNLYNTGFATVAVLGGGTVTNLFAANGRVSIAEGVDLTNFYVSGGEHVVEYDATAVTIYNQTGGKTTFRRPGPGSAATWRIVGGSVTFARKSTTASPGITLTNVTFEIGNANVNLVTAGTIAAVKLLHPNASLNWTRCPAAVTISSLEGNSQAIANTGLRATTQQTQFGVNVTVTAIVKYGLDVAQASDGSND
jgi:hypothetical protein